METENKKINIKTFAFFTAIIITVIFILPTYGKEREYQVISNNQTEAKELTKEELETLKKEIELDLKILELKEEKEKIKNEVSAEKPTEDILEKKN